AHSVGISSTVGACSCAWSCGAASLAAALSGAEAIGAGALGSFAAGSGLCGALTVDAAAPHPTHVERARTKERRFDIRFSSSGRNGARAQFLSGTSAGARRLSRRHQELLAVVRRA